MRLKDMTKAQLMKLVQELRDQRGRLHDRSAELEREAERADTLELKLRTEQEDLSTKLAAAHTRIYALSEERENLSEKLDNCRKWRNDVMEENEQLTKELKATRRALVSYGLALEPQDARP